MDFIVKTFQLEKAMETGPDIQDITDDIAVSVEKSRIRDGVVHLNVVGSTGSLTTIEFEPGVIEDLKDAVERMAPRGMDYKHELAWHDGNGHSHVQSALLGPSISICVHGGRLQLGTWQQVVVINHDNRPRKRKIAVTVVGTAG